MITVSGRHSLHLLYIDLGFCPCLAFADALRLYREGIGIFHLYARRGSAARTALACAENAALCKSTSGGIKQPRILPRRWYLYGFNSF